MRYFQHLLVIVFLVASLSMTGMAQKPSEPLALEGGLSLGMQEFQKKWIGTFGFLLEFGNPKTLQLRFALNSGLFNRVVVTQFETLFLVNFGNPDGKFYAGAGIGVPMLIGPLSEELPLSIVLIGGVKTPIKPTFTVQIEGGFVVPLSGDEGATLRGGLLGLFLF